MAEQNLGNKVFRIHVDGPDNHDWFTSGELNDKLIEGINTDGGDGKKLPTSIPSPFARIDLVRTAFASIKLDTIDGILKNGKQVSTDHHKLVSDALDIGQILFNYNSHSDDLSMIEWDRKTHLDNLLTSQNENQRHLGETLRLFLTQDRKQYNFDELDRIYILLYKYKIIGGTSPRTLFFASPNAVATDISFGKDKMLDDNLLALYQREPDYIKYLYSLSQTERFNDFFPEFKSYIDITVKKLETFNYDLFSELNRLDTTDYLEGFSNLPFNNNLGQPVKVTRNLHLKLYEKDSSSIEAVSDFVIKSTKEIESPKPLVLPTDSFTSSLTYTGDAWDSKTTVPFYDERPLDQRTLPVQNDKYPYLTMNDFLTNYIIRLPYDMNTEKFMTLGSDKYLFPLTKLFFDYFSAEDIKTKDFIRFKEVGVDSLEITLKIPIVGGSISYCKIYNTKDRASYEVSSEKGIVLDKSFALSLYPACKSTQSNINYSVGIADVSPERVNPLSVELYDDTSSGYVKKNSEKRATSPYETSQTVTSDSFDTIAVQYGEVTNFLLPKWTEFTTDGGDIYSFAIDFGTTNTHIEYQIESLGGPRALDIKADEEQIALLLSENAAMRTQAVRNVFDGQSHLLQETIPERIGHKETVSAPFRTCLLQNRNVNYTPPTYIFAHANIGFDYENTEIRKYLKPQTDLKWSQERSNERQVSHYLEEILMICRNKVTQNNGSLSQTKVIWFYPVSMTNNHLRKLKRTWDEAFEKVFGIDPENLIDYPESVAPFFHYANNENINTADRPSISIDIGGGTSDIMLYVNNKPQVISSFRFAGNSIFGNGFNGNIRSNGFVNFFLPEIKRILGENRLSDELNILNSIYSDYQSSTDLINFFFSLKNNKKMVDNDIEVDFSKMLETNEEFKIIFLIFYSAIIYHIADLMNIKKFRFPRNIVFSGTGSKTIKIVDSTRRMDAITPLFEGIFKKVFDNYDEYESDIKVMTSENPKEITCKGGIEMSKDLDVKELRHTDLIAINLANSDQPVVQSKRAEEGITYEMLDDDYLKGVLKNVDRFYDILEELNRSLGFKDEFGVSNTSLEIFRKLRSKDQMGYLKQGIKQLKLDSVDTDTVAQTLFFYPIIGLMYNIAVELGDKE